MQVPGLNLGEWLRRLGVRRLGWAPDYLENIVPVGIVHDGSDLVPPLLPPCAVAGCEPVGGGGLAYTAFQLFSNAPGGTYLRYVRISCGSATFAPWRIGDPIPLDAPLLLHTHNMGPTPVLGELYSSQQVAFALDSRNPASSSPNNGNCLEIHDRTLYIPPGKTFYFEASNTITSFASIFVWQEYPVTIPAT